ncbi:MAG: winged helix-turn-helix domain-containing protein [Nitrosopumilus sp.]|nr:winged helix-turn-helix domain-containing protein [Nitrosopumilus sp.]MDH3855994.1 winged helix-turn-helix domain-containing protein [Nitrosopumilus sp.]
MPFDSLCKNKIFREVADYDEIKVDPHMNELFTSVFTGMSGRYTRLRIICSITEIPMNTLELSKKLELDYKTIKHNIGVLEKNNLIIRQGAGYGDVFFPSDLISMNLPTLYKVIRKVEGKLDKSEKKYIE